MKHIYLHMAKRNIAIIFGGASPEHDISVLTGLHCAKNAPDNFSIKLVYLTRGGQMVTSGAYGKLANVDFYVKGSSRQGGGGGKRPIKKIQFKNIDCVINCCHGGVGEDGRLSAMFDVLQIPITSCPHLSAAALQSKSKTREVLSANGFAQPRFVVGAGGVGIATFPLIVKPDNGGSSIGISIAHNEEELNMAIDLAKTLCDKVVVEEFLTDVREINCAVFRYGEKLLVSGLEEIKKDKELFDFDTKYMDKSSGFVSKRKGNSAENGINCAEKIKELASKAYEIFGCAGVVRFDFLVRGEEIFLNEANTVPGFLAYHLWLKTGIQYTNLIEMMVENAVKSAKFDVKSAIFSSKVLENNRNLV